MTFNAYVALNGINKKQTNKKTPNMISFGSLDLYVENIILNQLQEHKELMFQQVCLEHFQTWDYVFLNAKILELLKITIHSLCSNTPAKIW